MKRIPTWSILGLGILALTIALAAHYCRVDAAEQQYNQKIKVGQKAPAFTGKGFPEGDVKLADYKGKVVMLDFWATWCGPCVHEMPNVIDAYKKYHPEGLEIIGISLDSDADRLKDFLGKNEGMKWKQVFDGKGWKSEVGQLYGVNAIPFTLLLDKDGVVRARDLRGDALGAEVAKLLGVEEKK